MREAHPSDAWDLSSNARAGIHLAAPRDFAERDAVATMCVRKLGIEFPALVDDLDNSTEIAYTAWPDRLFLIDEAGLVAYKAPPGPFGFSPAALESALEQLPVTPSPLLQRSSGEFGGVAVVGFVITAGARRPPQTTCGTGRLFLGI